MQGPKGQQDLVQLSKFFWSGQEAGFGKIWVRINNLTLQFATPFRRPWVSWRVISNIGELRGCMISASSQDGYRCRSSHSSNPEVGDDVSAYTVVSSVSLTL